MRPLALEMTAFGPFAGSERIDFRRLGESPLFLINGPTGAGKTSILDAMCFALYGETTGGERQGAEMRSHHADPATLTEISFEFELADKRYRIRRVPDQERPKARGEGTTQHKAEAQLDELAADGSARNLVPRKVGEVNQHVRELTGLSAEQFRQVMVLPQGRFRELLLAPSQEREAIFQQLFQTHVYARLERALKERAGALAAEIERRGERARGLLQPSGAASGNELAAAVTELAGQVAAAGTARRLAAERHDAAARALDAARQLAERFVAHGAARAELARIEGGEPARAAQRARIEAALVARALAPRHEALGLRQREHALAAARERAATEALERAVEAADRAGAARQEIAAREPELVRLRDEAARLRTLEPFAAALQQDEHELRERAGQRAHAAAALERSGAAQESAARELAGLDARIATLRATTATLADAPAALERHAALLRGRRQLADALEDLVVQRRARDVEVVRLGDAAAAERRASEGLRTLRAAWQAGQAAVLARALQPGAPCPVCGSADHPAPAAGAQAVPAEASLEVAHEAAEAARRAHEEARVALVRRDDAIAALQATQARLAAELGAHAALPLAELERQAPALRAHVQALQHARDELVAEDARRAGSLSRLAERAAELEAAREAAARARHAETEAEATLQARRAQLPEALRPAGALAAALTATTAALAHLEAAIEAAERAQQQARESLAGARAEASAAAAELERSAGVLQEADAAWQERLAASPFADASAFRQALLEPAELAGLQQGLREQENALLLARRALEQSAAAIAGAVRPDVEALERAEQAARSASEAAIGELHVLGDRLDALRKTQAALAALLAEQAALEGDYAVTGRLARVANGGNPHNLSLQRFVLSVLLDEVLVEAGHRLRVMSRGRYRLSRREEVRDARSKSGLELDVEDAYTGRLRSVATLSGGESFMAALALALGLSDVVQAHSGGIRLDTLFVDEGFGSLDADALELAIRTLIDLQASGRMVGIISHVPELKQQMDVQVVVEPGPGGSHLRLVVPGRG